MEENEIYFLELNEIVKLKAVYVYRKQLLIHRIIIFFLIFTVILGSVSN